MPIIRQLPPDVVNKIAAGEVIERPASVVKELLENAVDSGASRIDLSVEQGGTELIRVVDNGCGMSPEQLPLALASHATSKISDADDLFRVDSLGFRGEALASIGAVSQMSIRSRLAETSEGAEIEINGGIEQAVAPCGCPIGTNIEVRNLFFNVPVRRKFLRTTQTEMSHISEALTRLALPYPHIHFTLRHNGRPVLELPAVDSWRQRIETIFDREISDNLISVDSRDGPMRLSGFVANPTQSRANNRLQYLFLNNRHIRDRSLQHALREAYRGLLLTGRFPIAFLRLELPAEVVDVNVHPAKLEVRFQDSGRIYSQLLGTLRSEFLATDLTATVDAPIPDDTTAHDIGQSSDMRQQIVSWAQNPTAPSGGGGSGDYSRSTGATPPFLKFHDGGSNALQKNDIVRPDHLAGDTPEHFTATDVSIGEPPTSEADRRASALQIHNRYLIAEDERGVVIIDQHALHERILYEQIREKVLAEAVETQKLLVPEPVALTPAEAAAGLEAKELLLQLGIEIEDFGSDTLLVSSYPAMLANLSPSEILRQAIEVLMTGIQQLERRDLLDELMHMISCKAAIKAGDRLSHEEITSLIEQRHLVQDAHHCPHGRPTTLVFTREELDRRFRRI